MTVHPSGTGRSSEAEPDRPSSPEVRLEPAARAFLRERGGHLTLRGSRRHGCCGGVAFVPTALPERPASPEDYRTLEVEGVTVHLDPTLLDPPPSFRIGLDSLLGMKRLRVEGPSIAV